MRRPLPLLAAAGLLAAATACSRDDGDPVASPSVSPSVAAEPSASASPSEPAEPTCEPFPTENVELLLQSAAAPPPAPVEGPVSVETSLPGAVGPVFVVAFKLGDKTVALAHPVQPGEDATAGGSWVSLTSYTQEVTAQPRDPAVEDALDGKAVTAALDCVS